MAGCRQKTIEFTKMSGTGNDFIVINNFGKKLKVNWNELAKKYCPRQTGIGADGIIIIEPAKHTDFTMRIINADGSEAEMCGNGARCAAVFALKEGITGKKMTFSTLAGIIEARASKDNASIRMPEPKDLKGGIKIKVSGKNYIGYFLNTGVPHTIVFVGSVKDVAVDSLGRLVRYHEIFSPRGTNVDFVEVTGEDSISVRTYERGVEGETLACGTGAVASAILSNRFKNVTDIPVKVNMPGGMLQIEFKRNGDLYTDAWLIGPVDTVFKGIIA